MTPARARSAKLDWIEAGRGIAATVVVVSHVGTLRPIPIDRGLLGIVGDAGVAFFFVLSGFIMLHIHDVDIGRPRTTAHFLWRRLGRIFPTYWIVFSIYLGVNLLLQRSSARVDPDASFLARNLLLLPGDRLLIGPAWTLRSELFFYAAFALLLVNRRLGQAVLLVWLAAMLWHLVLVGMWTAEVDAAPDLYIHHVNLYFFAGLFVCWSAKRGWAVPAAWMSALLGAGLLAVAQLLPAADRALVSALGLIPAYGALVALCFVLSAGRWRAPRPLVWLGAISYSLYLLHLCCFILLRGVDNALGHPLDRAWPVRVAVQIAVAVGAAAALHAVVERPILRWVNTRRSVLGVGVARPVAVAA